VFEIMFMYFGYVKGFGLYLVLNLQHFHVLVRKLPLQPNGNALDDFYSNFKVLFFVVHEEHVFQRSINF